MTVENSRGIIKITDSREITAKNNIWGYHYEHKQSGRFKEKSDHQQLQGEEKWLVQERDPHHVHRFGLCDAPVPACLRRRELSVIQKVRKKIRE